MSKIKRISIIAILITTMLLSITTTIYAEDDITSGFTEKFAPGDITGVTEAMNKGKVKWFSNSINITNNRRNSSSSRFNGIRDQIHGRKCRTKSRVQKDDDTILNWYNTNSVNSNDSITTLSNNKPNRK